MSQYAASSSSIAVILLSPASCVRGHAGRSVKEAQANISVLLSRVRIAGPQMFTQKKEPEWLCVMPIAGSISLRARACAGLARAGALFMRPRFRCARDRRAAADGAAAIAAVGALEPTLKADERAHRPAPYSSGCPDQFESAQFDDWPYGSIGWRHCRRLGHVRRSDRHTKRRRLACLGAGHLRVASTYGDPPRAVLGYTISASASPNVGLRGLDNADALPGCSLPSRLRSSPGSRMPL